MILSDCCWLVPWRPKFCTAVLSSVITKVENGVGSYGGRVIGTNELPDAINWFIRELMLCAKGWSTAGLLNCLVCNLLGKRQSLSIPHEFSFVEYYYFFVRIGVSIGMKGMHNPLTQMFCTCCIIHMSFDHSSFHHILLGKYSHDPVHDHNL